MADSAQRSGQRSRSKSGNPRKKVLEDESWYHGFMPREDITKMLISPGDWLVRKTEVNGESKHILSIFWGIKANHVVLHKTSDGQRYYINAEKEFANVQELIHYYKNTNANLPRMAYRMITAIPKQEWELRHEWIVCEKKIGEGAFGEVFLGTLCIGGVDGGRTPFKVAIKRSHVSREMTKAEIIEVVSESRIMQKFKHPNLVRLWGVAAETQPIMLVLELISGGGLDGHLKKNKTALNTKIKYMCDAAKGTKYLHEAGCLHRDLACRNCLISGDGVVKISDFGLSHEGKSYMMKATDKVPIRWLALETLLPGPNFGKYTLRTDVWSFGIMCWEILHDGLEPYPGMRVKEVAEEVKKGYRMSLDDPLFPVPADLKELIVSMWYNAEQRPDMPTVAAKFVKLSKDNPPV